MTSLSNAPVPEALVLPLIIIMSVQIWGSLGVVMQVGIWLLLLLYLAMFRPRAIIKVLKWWPLLILPLYALASTAWSVAPAVSARYGVQLLITALMGLTIASSTTPRRLVALLFGGVTVMLLLSVTFYRSRFGPSEEGLVLIGATGSKNEFGYAAQLMLGLSLTILIDRAQPIGLRVATLPMSLLAMAVLATSQAAGALIASGVTVVVIIAVALLHLFKLPGRVLALAIAAIIVTPAIAEREAIETSVTQFAQDKLGKDMRTLTGRKYLWARADELIKERPMLGRGYRAVMAGDTVEGNGILAWAGQRDGRAFHFHNTYRDLAVDLGLPGAIFFAGMLALALPFMTRTVISHPTPTYGLFLAVLAVIIARSLGELVIGQFGLYPCLLFCVWSVAFGKPANDEQWVRAADVERRPLLRRKGPELIRLTKPVRQR